VRALERLEPHVRAAEDRLGELQGCCSASKKERAGESRQPVRF
jgi:hypothetical protein